MYFISEKWWYGRYARGIVTLCMLVATFSAAHGQVMQDNRCEYLLGEGEQPFQIAPAQEDGIFLYRGFEGTEANALQLVALDTSFNERWSGFITIDRQMTESKVCYANNSLYVLLRYRDFSKHDMQIVDINKEKGNYVTHSFRNFIPMQITSFQVTREGALIGGYFNRVPVVLFYSFSERRSKLLPGLFNEAGDLIQIRTYADGTFDILVSALNYMRQQTIIIRNYDAEGNIIKNLSLKPDEKKNLIFGQSIKTFQDMQVVAGVYGNRASEFSKGIFMASIDPAGNDRLKYYTYGDLENFFKYMRARREQRVKDRIARRRIKGRKIRFNYRFIVHEIVPYKDQYIMLGEAFYPKYIYTDRSYGSFFGQGPGFGRSPMMQNGRVFDGYYYTHAVVIGFDHNGKLLWDNSFEINDVRTFELEQFVKLDVRPDHITLLYLYDHQIRSKIIDDNEVLEGKSIDPIRLKYDTDLQTKKGSTEKSRLAYWYGHNFYAYGVQTVINTGGEMPLKRRVFFINKVTHP